MRASECVAVAQDLATGALLMDPDFGGPYLVRGAAAVAVHARNALLAPRGEFFADLENPAELPLVENDHVPASEAILGDAVADPARLQVAYRRTLAAVPGVAAVVALNIRVEGRQYSVDAVARTGFDDEPPQEVAISV